MINPIILDKNNIKLPSSIRHPWHPLLLCLPRLVSELVIYIDTQHNHQCFHRTCCNYAFPKVGEWVSDVILGDQEGGMRLLYHPEGESTRFYFTFIFTAKY